MALMEANLGGGWFALPTPKPGGYNPTYTHLENSYRDAVGYLHRDIIRKNVSKVECSYNALTQQDVQTLQNLYGYDSFWLRFTDKYGNRVEKQVYAGPVGGKVERINHNDYKPEIVTDMSVSFVEY